MKLKNYEERNPLHALWSTGFAILYGVAVLSLLVAIEHVDWVHIKPATGTAAALYNASSHPDHDQKNAKVEAR